MQKIKVYIEKTLGAKENLLPQYMTEGAAGVDICAFLEKPVILKPGNRALIPTGIKIALPVGFEAQIRPRSGLAINYGVTLLNTPGTIDSDYRGEIKVIMINLGDNDFTISNGDRIAQMILNQCYQFDFKESESIQKTERNDGGFGHTGHR